MLRRIAGLLALLVLLALPARAEPDYPPFTGLVVDAAHVLSDADKAAITSKLEALKAKTGVQFAVATVPSLGGDEIEPYANALFRRWGIGTKGVDNGLLLILAPKEHKLRFEVGYGLEGTMTDAQSKLILQNDMVPKLKAGDPSGAIRAGVDDAIAVLAAPAAGLPQDPGKTDNGGLALVVGIVVLLVVFGLIVTVIVLVVRRGQWTTGSGGTWGTGIPVSNDSSTGGDTSGGDSFSGGGGGDSGGGGASSGY